MPEGIHEAAPIASALVIGIGGSGVQTLARLRSAVRDRNRPGQVAMDNVKFLAIDSVEQNDQIPALPPGTGLSKDEFYNIARDAMNANRYVKTAWRNDAILRESWDVDYRPPNESLTQGMKRSRPLGNLVFRTQSSRVQDAIRTSLNQVLSLAPEQMAGGSDGGRSQLPVFIVASSAGGTGSSGFLHVLHAVHRAAGEAGVSAQVYPVLFLPDVFAHARDDTANPAATTRGHWANAYAFFAELDHVLTEPQAFDDLLCPAHALPTNVETVDVVKAAFLIDGRLTDGGQFDEADAFDIAATGVYSLLVTENRSLIGAEGTNDDSLTHDDQGARTVYAGLGALRVVYPGSTYRRYLQARLRAHLLQEYLLDESANEGEHGGPVRDLLVSQLSDLTASFAEEARQQKEVRTLQTRAANAAEEVSDRERVEDINLHLSQLLKDADKAASRLETTLPSGVKAAVGRIDGLIDAALRDSGEGIAALRFALDKARAQLTADRDDKLSKVSSAKSVTETFRGAQSGSLRDKLERVRQAHARFFMLRGGELREAANGYQEACEQFANGVQDAHVRAAEAVVLGKAVERLDEVRRALIAAARVIGDERAEADRIWRLDSFEGKDAGGLHVTSVVPSDVQSNDASVAEVEDSRIAVAAWKRLQRDLSENPDLIKTSGENAQDDKVKPGSEWVRHVYQEWWRLGANRQVRGLVALGQGETDAAAQLKSKEYFDTILTQQVAELARVTDLLPTSLESAAAMADAAASGDIYDVKDLTDFTGDESRRLDTLVRETLKKAAFITLQLDPAKVRLQHDAALAPAVQTLGASGRMRERIAELVPGARVFDTGDPEQIKSVTIQMQLPIAAVGGVERWFSAYRQVNLNRRRNGERSVDPPPHLDTRFAAVVAHDPVAPRQYDDDTIAEFIVQGFALLLLTRNDADLVAEFGDVATLKTEYGSHEEVVVFGYPLTIEDGRTHTTGDRLRMGSTQPEVFDAAGRSPKFQQGTNDVFDFLLERAKVEADEERPELLQALKERVTQYRKSNHDNAAALPREHISEEVEREIELRAALDRAAARLLHDMESARKPDLAPTL